MVQPTARDLHVDVALTNISVKYNNAELIAEKIFPVVTVKKDSDLYFTYGKQDFRIYKTQRAPGTRAKQIDWTADHSNSYVVAEHALEEQLIDEVRDNADDPIKYDADSVEYVTNALMLDIEKNVADTLQSASNYAAGNTGDASAPWDDFSGSDPVKDVDNAKQVVKDSIFMYPNTMIVSDKLHKVLRRHPKLLEMYKYTRGGTLSVDILKEIFEVQNYFIGGAGYLTSKEGQTDATGNVWNNTDAKLLYVPSSPGIKQLSYGYIFRKAGFRKVLRWREDWVESDFIRVSDKYVTKVISNVAGYLLTKTLGA